MPAIHVFTSGPAPRDTRHKCPCCRWTIPGFKSMCTRDSARVPAAVWALGLDAAVAHVNRLNDERDAAK